MHNESYYAHGKLLLSGEYFVLDGAKALAIPARFGQHLEVQYTEPGHGRLYWESLSDKNLPLLTVTFELDDFKIIEKKGELPHYLLQDALRAARLLGKGFLRQKTDVRAISRLEFSMGWGLGSSSTLIHNIAAWAKVDAFDLFFSVMEGSGYDIACAGAKKPVVYQVQNNHAIWNEIDFNAPFTGNIVFAYLGKKQNSRQAIRQYRDNDHAPELIDKISSITERMIAATDADEFISLMKSHEDILSAALRLAKVQDRFFQDFPGAVKSLGAWGGDFVMALSENKPEQTISYFNNKGFNTVFSYNEMLFKAD